PPPPARTGGPSVPTASSPRSKKPATAPRCIEDAEESLRIRGEDAIGGHSSPGVCDGGGREGVVDSAGSPASIQVERRPPPNLPRAADVAGEEPRERRSRIRGDPSGSA